MPSETMHICRLTTRSYDEYRTDSCGREDDEGRCIAHVYGIWEEDGERTSEIHELQFRLDEGWSESAARSYCDEEGGSFEAAIEEEAADEDELYGALTSRAPVEMGVEGGELPDEARQALEELRVPLDEVYVFPVTASNQAMDTFGTRMSAESIERYVENARSGVPLMNSHRTGGGGFLTPPTKTEQPLGYSFWADADGEPVDEAPLIRDEREPEQVDADLMETGQAVQAWDYVLRDHYPNGRSEPGTEDLIRSIEGKTTRDISIGFGAAIPQQMRYICGLCGHPLSSEECEHVPLVRDEETGYLAFAWVRGAEMYEHSVVWAGSTPGAIVDKAKRMARRGRLDSTELDLLEGVYEVRIRPDEIAVAQMPGLDLEDDMEERERVDEAVPGDRESSGQADEVDETRGPVPFHEWPAGREDGEWDGDAAVADIREWASTDGSGDKDTIDWTDYREGFGWYDVDDRENFGAYKLPHHETEDGSLVTPLPGVQAAMAATLGARGGVDIPEDDRETVYNHLSRHYDQFNETPPDFHVVEEQEEGEGVTNEDILTEFRSHSEQMLDGMDRLAESVGRLAESLEEEEDAEEEGRLAELKDRLEALEREERTEREVADADRREVEAVREMLVDEVVRMRVRAGFEVQEEELRKKLSDVSISALKREAEALEDVVAEKFIAGRPTRRVQYERPHARVKEDEKTRGDEMSTYKVGVK